MRVEVPEGWGIRPLGDVVDVRLSSVDKKSSEDEVPVRLCNYMDVYSNPEIREGLPFMRATASPDQIKRFGLEPGDVIITKDSEQASDIAVPTVVAERFEEPLVCGYHLAMLRPKDVDGAYLAWALRSRPVNDQFVRRANGTTRFGLTSSVIHEVAIPFPPLPEQRKIAAILSSVDDAIAATRKVIEQAERVKQGLLQTLMTRGIGHIRFKQTEIGDIPEEWEVVRLGGISSIRRGASPRPISDPKWFADEGAGWVRISDVTRARRFLRETEQYLSREGVAKSVPLQRGDVIMSICATIGVPVIVDIDACIHDGFVVFQDLDDSVTAEFLRYFIQWKTAWLESLGQHGTQKNLNTGIVKSVVMALPPRDEQNRIADVLLALDERVDGLRVEVAQQETLKRGLLQDLLTGRVRVTPD